LVPSPLSVARAAGQDAGLLLERAAFTLGSALLGLTISGAFAVALALAFTSNKRLANASLPLVIAFRSAPVTAIAPVVMLAVGRGIGTSIIVVTIVSFFPLYVNVMRGLSAPDPSTVELMLVAGASRWQQLRYVRIPYALPYLFTGLRIAGGSAILGAMLSEWLTGSPGLGLLILKAGDMREVELLWAAVLLSIFVALAIFWTTSAGERAALSWRR
jgi:ABC-type nitrate/sulfonate/bicarbonate transport system permease component